MGEAAGRRRLPDGLKQVQSTAGVDVEIVERTGSRQIVARLGGGVNQQVRLELLDALEHAVTAAEGEPKFFAMGHAQFRNLYKTFVADTTKVRIESVHTYVNGNMGWDWTNFYADVKPEKVKDYPPSPVRILFVWEKINGQWFCSGDVVLLGTFDTTATQK